MDSMDNWPSVGSVGPAVVLLVSAVVGVVSTTAALAVAAVVGCEEGTAADGGEVVEVGGEVVEEMPEIRGSAEPSDVTKPWC